MTRRGGKTYQPDDPHPAASSALASLVLALMLCGMSVACRGVDILNYNASDDTTTITIENEPTIAGTDRIVDDAVGAVTLITGVSSLNLLSGTGDETIILNALDDATSFVAMSLSGDNSAGTDTGDDTFLITPSTQAEVRIEGGEGQDRLVIEANGNDVTGTRTSIQLAGHESVSFADDVERIDLVGEDELEDSFEVMPSLFAEIHVEGLGEFDTLVVVAPARLVVDSGTYIEVCNHERIYYTSIEQVTIQAPALNTMNYNAAEGGEITISDVPATPLTEQIEQTGLPTTVTLVDINELNMICHATGNLIELLALDTCTWLLVIALIGQDGPDAFEVTAQLGTEVDVQGGAGVDTLTVDALGNAAVDQGTHIEIDGYQDITYSGIETVILINVAPSASIEVRGDGNVIANGDQTPSTRDLTDLGDVPVDGSTSQSFFIHSLSAVPLQLTDVPQVKLIGSADFTVSLQPPSLPIAQGGTAKFTIRCTPSEVGTHRATVSIANSDFTKDPYQFDIQCTGTQAPEISVRGNNQEIENGDDTPSASDHTEFGYLGQTNITRTFHIRNTGTEALHLYNAPDYVTVNHEQFEVTRQPEQEIAVDGATTFAITVHPGPEDAPEATVSIWNTDANEDPFTFTIHAGGSEEDQGPWPDAGPDQIVVVGERVILDGTGSRDSQIASLTPTLDRVVGPKAIQTYRWEFAVRSAATGASGFMIPEGSMCMFSVQGFDTAVASFVPDVEGEYILELHVTNDSAVSMMDTVVVTALPMSEPAGDFRLDRFTCSPNPFSTSVAFGFEGGGIPDLMDVSIHDLSGTQVWSARVLNKQHIPWDGRTATGVDLQNGAYIYVMTIVSNGQRYSQQGVIFILR